MSIYSLDTLSKEGALRLVLEMVVLFVTITVGYLFVIEPALQSVAPTVYVQSGLDYSRTDLPNTASEVTHLLLTVGVVGGHLFWRLNYTALGERFSNAVEEDRGSDQ